MYKYLLLLIFPCLLQNQQDKEFLGQRFKGRDSSVVFIAIIRSNTLKSFFPEKRFNKYYNKETHTFKEGFSVLYNEAKKYYNLSKEKAFILSKIDRWLKNDSLLNTIPVKENTQIEEVLFENYHTKFLFKKYLLEKGQTWESLTSWQSYELYIDFLNYTECLSKSKLKNLFSSLMHTSRNL